MGSVRGKNILKNQNIIVHLPDTDNVVIIKSIAHIIQDDEIDNVKYSEFSRRNIKLTKGCFMFTCIQKKFWCGMAKD